MTQPILLALNAGSSNIKFSIFKDNKKLHLLYKGNIENLHDQPYIKILNPKKQSILEETIDAKGYKNAFQHLFNWLNTLSHQFILKAVGHRVVHGGVHFKEATLITHKVIENLRALIPLAPLHQPYPLEAIKILQKLYPGLPQIACFDTSFHQSQEKLAKLFAIPRALTKEGIIRYGFHGISYEYIASVLFEKIGKKAKEKVIVAHLGHGASLCAMKNYKSVATSMGFSALDGLMMGTRSGSIDPGVLLYLLDKKKYSVSELSELLYQSSGLLGVSGISGDIQSLFSSQHPHAIEAIALFCYRAAKEISALCMCLEGCDALIFTGGIGENAWQIRQKICKRLKWLGIEFDDRANQSQQMMISKENSPILVAVIPTNEEYMIAKFTQKMLEK
jgi:acetate kinase